MDKKELKLKAEQHLFEAASRYFEEPDCVEKAQKATMLKETTLYTKTGRPVEIPDELYNKLFTANPLGTLEGDDFGEKDTDVLQTDMGDTADEIKYANAVAADLRASAKQKAAAKIADTNNETFNQLIPKIEKFLTGYVKKAVEKGAINSVGKGHWEIPSACVKQANDNVWKYVIDPAYREVMHTQGKKAAADFRRGWVKYSGFGSGLTGLKDAMMDALYVKESAFYKAMNKALNEVLTSMYSEKYNVCLSEANKMFIVDDIIVE